MLNFNKQYDETVKNYPSDDSTPIISTIFANSNRIGVDSLSLTILNLINDGQIKCDIDRDDSYEVNKKLTSQDMEVMKGITLRIANKGELKTSETLAVEKEENISAERSFFEFLFNRIA